MSLRFARSFSFPVPSAAGKHASYKHRSVSLPARLHPIVAQIARSALRRRDEAALCSALRAQKKVEKQLLKLAASARGIGRSGPAEPEVGSVAREATTVTAVASAAVFAGMAMLASAAMAGVSKGTTPACVVGALVWRSAAFKRRMEVEDEGWRERAMKRMEAVEKCISELEICCQRVLRGMLNTRVFLLNAQTPLM
ncbi:hypothetical protein KSP39_PZI022760 [Platanthera zijinensis]|uniref:Uncharacterized protein n=1 Tax=Platanthera zijinensis TaxID=2320716 RepID=A0AAP0AV78_9ASPA